MTAPALPRREMHVHLEGTVRPPALLRYARRNGVALPADTPEKLADLYAFRDFAHFIEVWILTTNVLRTRDDFRETVVDYAAEAAACGATYVEAIFSPAERVQRGVAWADLFEGYCDGAVEAAERHGVTVRFTPDIYRGLDPALAVDVAEWSVRYRDRGVVGLGIGGMETAAPLSAYLPAFEIAAAGGLPAVPHAGETTDPAHVAEALELLSPRRIRHGIRAVDDPGLLRELAARGIVLDVCLTSNLCTGAVASLDAHPLPQLLAAGVACSLSTDDPAMFGTDLDKEYALAASLGVPEQPLHDAALAGALDPTAVQQ